MWSFISDGSKTVLLKSTENFDDTKNKNKIKIDIKASVSPEEGNDFQKR